MLHLKQPFGNFVQEADEITQKELEIWKCHHVFWCELTHLVPVTKKEFLTTMIHCYDRTMKQFRNTHICKKKSISFGTLNVNPVP